MPQNLDELWADFSSLDRDTPLEAETLKEWNEGDVVCRVVRFQVGVFKGTPSRVAGLYAFPTGGTSLPALLHLHGGGQSASLDSVVTDARRGYAALSLNPASTPWQGPREIRNLRWEGGEYAENQAPDAKGEKEK